MKARNIWMKYGDKTQEDGDFYLAVHCYNKILKLDPNNKKALFETGKALISMKKYREALKCYEKITSINLYFENVWLHKGLAQYAAGKNRR